MSITKSWCKTELEKLDLEHQGYCEIFLLKDYVKTIFRFAQLFLCEIS